jgi:uncharacterized protein RhaS with RHS repeats
VGAREYDPRTARWLQRDPIGIAAGHPNVYLYCGNDPLNAADPYGLDWDWAKYFRDVGNVFVGYGQAIWGVISSPYTIGKYYWENGVSWESTKQLVGGMWSGFCGDWQAAWEGDAQAFGRAFGGVLIAVGTAAAPFAKGGTVPKTPATASAAAANGLRQAAAAGITIYDIVKNPQLLNNLTLSQVAKLAKDAGWEVGHLRRGSQAGKGLVVREVKNGKYTGRMIQWHPGGGHHGSHPYWKVSTPECGTIRIGPQFP